MRDWHMTEREVDNVTRLTKALGEASSAVRELNETNRTMARLYGYARHSLAILEEVATELHNEFKEQRTARLTRKKEGGAE